MTSVETSIAERLLTHLRDGTADSAETDLRLPAWPQPWGRATVPGIISSVISTGTRISPAFDVIRASPPSTRPRAAASSGCTRSSSRRESGISFSALCIQELWDRISRIPMSR